MFIKERLATEIAFCFKVQMLQLCWLMLAHKNIHVRTAYTFSNLLNSSVMMYGRGDFAGEGANTIYVCRMCVSMHEML